MLRTTILITLALTTPLAAQESNNPLVQAVVDDQLEKMKGMTAEESFAYLRTWGTAMSMESLGLALRAHKLKYGAYPRARTIAELEKALVPGTVPEIETKDKWGHEYRYIVSADGKTFKLVSAGSGGLFDEASWPKKGTFANTEEDAVLENGEFTRVWNDRPHAESRYAYTANQNARALLERAWTQSQAKDFAGALASYIDAVKIEPAAAKVELIEELMPVTEATSQPHRAAALRHYLQLHPGDAEATDRLISAVEPKEAESILAAALEKRPNDANLYARRGLVRASAGRFADALADYAKASSLDATNAERHYTLGVVAYEVAKKSAGSQKTELLRRAMESLARAVSLRSDYAEAIVYRSIVLREQAAVETDPARAKKLTAEADAAKAAAMEMLKKRR